MSTIANALAGQGSAPPTLAAPPAPPVADLGSGGTPTVAPPTAPVMPAPAPPDPAEQYVKNLETQKQGEQEYDDFLYKTDPIKYRQANPRGYLTRKIHDALTETVGAAAGRGIEHDPEYLKKQVAPFVKSIADTAAQVYTGGLLNPRGVGKTEGLQDGTPLFPLGAGALTGDLASVQRLAEGAEVPANLKSANPKLKNGLPAESPISFASVGGKEIPVERRAPGSVGRTPGTKLKQTVDTTYELGRKYGVGTPESAPTTEAPKPPSTFASVGGTAIEKRAPDSLGRNGGSFGNAVDSSYEAGRKYAAEPAPKAAGDTLQTNETGNLWDTAVKQYGKTEDINKAGFIGPDGSMLDFSDGQAARTLDHGAIGEVKGVDAQSPRESFVGQTGAIRVLNGPKFTDIHFDAEHPPTAEQLDRIIPLIGEGKHVNVDVSSMENEKYGTHTKLVGGSADHVEDLEGLQRVIRDAQKDANRKLISTGFQNAYGDTGKALGKPGEEPADALISNERQSALREPYKIEIRNSDGTARIETVDAFSSKDAMKVAQKKFPDASEWARVPDAHGQYSDGPDGARTPSTEYSVPNQKLLSIPEGENRKAPEIIRHELGHGMIGANEGMVPNGMMRHTAEGMQGNRASVVWKAEGLFEPGQTSTFGRVLKPEKIPMVVKTMMGGPAMDEIGGLHRSANHNMDIKLSHSDGNQAYNFLRAAGFAHEGAIEYMNDAIDRNIEHLTNRHVSDVIKENEGVREPGLSRQFHYSPERLQNMNAEAQRRIQNEGFANNRTTDGSSASNSAADVAGGKSGVAKTTDGVSPKEITANEVKPKDEERTFVPATRDDYAKAVAANPHAASLSEVSQNPGRIFQMTEGGEKKPVFYSVTKDGDIVGIVNNSGGAVKKSLDAVMPHAIEQGGNHLDAWDINGTLPKMYAKYGFKTIKTEAYDAKAYGEPSDALKNSWTASGWKEGDPYPSVVHMALPEKLPTADIPESEQAATLGNRISSRFPSAVSATEDPMGHDLTLSGDMVLKSPKVAQRLADKIVAQNKSMAFAPEELKTPKGIFDSFTQHAKDNIKAMYERVSPENRIQDREWYDNAHEIGNRDAKVSGLEPRQHWAAIATQSPQKDWNQNVSLYERILDIVQNKSDVKFTPEMQAKAKDFIQDIAASNKKRVAEGKSPISPWVDNYLVKRLKGKSLAEITDPVEKAAFVRIYDEAHNPREFREIKPDGTKGDIVKLAGTDTPEKVAWGGLNPIAKGISVLQDGSLENISRNLGEAHKVRSFYNNIAEPNAEQGDVTVDTHHVGIGLMRPVAGDDPETGLNFGGNGSTITGVHGTYPLYVDATRQAMHEINAEHPNDPPLEHPRQLQSVVWVEWRKLFPPEARTAKTKLDVDNIWKEHLDGKITADEARQRVFKYADELRSRLDAGTQSPADEGELPAHQLSGPGSPAKRGGKSSTGVDKQLDAGAKAIEAAEAARVAKNKADLADYVARSAAKKKAAMSAGISALGKPKK